MLSNVTDGNRALLQTVLLGQPQLRQVIASPDLDQLRQRILASYHLAGLSREETRAYVEHRMRAVGWTGTPAWQEGSLGLVHRYTGGIPRRINRLCARVLLGASLEEVDLLTTSMVEATALELEADLGAGLAPPRTHVDVGHSFQSKASHFLDDGQDTRIEELTGRIDALERSFARRERVFQRLMDLLSTGSVGR
jgi:hypothetical protein